MAVSFLQSASDSSNLTTYTFSGQNLGTEATDRYIIVGIMGRKAGTTNRTINSVTVGGVTATIVHQQFSSTFNTNIAGLAIALVPTGAAGDVVVTFGGEMVRAAIALYRATGINPAEFQKLDSIALDPTVALDIPANGFAIGVGLTAANSSAAWTGLTEDFDITVEAGAITATGAHDSFVAAETDRTLTIDFAAAVPLESVGVFASWSPFTEAPQRMLTGMGT